MAMMIDSMVNIRDFELMVSDTDMSKAGKGPMNIEIHWALADELITRLREAKRDAARYKYLKSDHKTKNLYSYQQDMKDRYWDEDIDSEIDQAMKEKGDE